VDLGTENHRSPGTQILDFGNDIMTGTIRGRCYDGVSRAPYNPKTHEWSETLRKALPGAHMTITGAVSNGALIALQAVKLSTKSQLRRMN
jgi:hypothetical protein